MDPELLRQQLRRNTLSRNSNEVLPPRSARCALKTQHLSMFKASIDVHVSLTPFLTAPPSTPFAWLKLARPGFHIPASVTVCGLQWAHPYL
eukprot:1158356-Pelagomonas_calceolata.AAC.9